MAVTPSTYYLEGVNQTKIAITRDGLKNLFNQAEAELHRSEVYQHAIDNLCKGLGETASQVYQTLIQTVGREAIRVALRQLLRQYRSLPPHESHLEDTISVQSVELEPSASTPRALPSPPNMSVSPTTAMPSTPIAVAPAPDLAIADKKSSTPPLNPVATAKPSGRNRAVTETQRRRQAIFAQIGDVISEARATAGLTIEELHYKTWIPLHQLKALEMGDPERLPEDIYVRGFIRRIAGVLKLDVEGMLTALNLSEELSVIPSWHDSIPAPRQLQPMHLYLGYAALMAGAAGGLAWMSQQPMSGQLVNQHLPDLFKDADVQTSPRHQNITGSPSSSMNRGAIANPEAAPPEGLPF